MSWAFWARRPHGNTQLFWIKVPCLFSTFPSFAPTHSLASPHGFLLALLLTSAVVAEKMGMTDCSFLGVAWSTCLGSGGRKGTETIVVDPDGYFAFPRTLGGEISPSLYWGRGLLGLTLHGGSTQGAGLFSLCLGPLRAWSLDHNLCGMKVHPSFLASWVSSWFFPVY